jgi:hypothetical protein
MKRKGRHWVAQNLRRALMEFSRVPEADLGLPKGIVATNGSDSPPTAKASYGRDGDAYRNGPDEAGEQRP